ncbi:MAG: hypothetical protein Kow00109_05750 [Acidobacteriota bacterium]
MPIPFLDLISLHQPLEEELLDVVRRALRTAQFIGGPEVAAFEEEFAAYCGVPYCAGVGSGTDAVRFALMACGVGRGDAVITVAHTFIATVEGICQAGAEPEFVDIDERTYNMSPEALGAYLASCETDPATGRPRGRRSGLPVKAIVPVHLYGQPADMDPILELANRYGLLVIEDAAQAHGAEYASRFQVSGFRFQESGKVTSAKGQSRSLEPAPAKEPETCNLKPETSLPRNPGTSEPRNGRIWLRAGAFGHAAAFSFYPGKNLGACGEAGAVVSRDPEVIARVKMIRDHGQAQKYYHEVEGYNGRLDAIQAGMLRIKLRHLDDWNARRRAAAARYAELLAPLAVPRRGDATAGTPAPSPTSETPEPRTSVTPEPGTRNSQRTTGVSAVGSFTCETRALPLDLGTSEARNLGTPKPRNPEPGTAGPKRAAEQLSGRLILPYVPPNTRPVWHLYVIRVADRDGLLEHLKRCGIGAALHYPVPVHLQKAYAHLGYREGDLPVTERICREVLSLPMFPDLTPEQQTLVTNAITDFLNAHSPSNF